MHARKPEVLVKDKTAEQVYYWSGQMFASPPQVFGCSECLVDEVRNLLGAFSCLFVSQSQALGLCVSRISIDQS